mmetsp:Transcript_14117/g.39002  ORF Transcript_14117/g.39002 Transcript_14117/m.39002 type:complete len:300 (-) Transcript_14117:551-1450(-)
MLAGGHWFRNSREIKVDYFRFVRAMCKHGYFSLAMHAELVLVPHKQRTGSVNVGLEQVLKNFSLCVGLVVEALFLFHFLTQLFERQSHLARLFHDGLAQTIKRHDPQRNLMRGRGHNHIGSGNVAVTSGLFLVVESAPFRYNHAKNNHLQTSLAVGCGNRRPTRKVFARTVRLSSSQFGIQSILQNDVNILRSSTVEDQFQRGILVTIFGSVVLFEGFLKIVKHFVSLDRVWTQFKSRLDKAFPDAQIRNEIRRRAKGSKHGSAVDRTGKSLDHFRHCAGEWRGIFINPRLVKSKLLQG